MLDENRANHLRTSNAFAAEEQAPGKCAYPDGTGLQNGSYARRVQADRASGGKPGCDSCLPPAPLSIRLDDADGPTNARAGGIRLVEGKARTEFDPYALFPLSSRK